MKNNLILISIFSICCAACAEVRPTPPSPFQQIANESANQSSGRNETFEKFEIVRTTGLVSQIGDHNYTLGATSDYYKASGALEAATMAEQAIAADNSGKLFLSGGLASGAVLGFSVFYAASAGYLGKVDGLFAPPSASSEGFLPSFYGIIGMCGGVLIGGTIGELFYHYGYYPKAKKSFDDSADSFNKFLGDQIKLEIRSDVSHINGLFTYSF